MPQPPKRDQIIKAAYDIFKQNSFFSVSMDELIDASNVSRRTMYNHFASKNQLIKAVMEHYQADYLLSVQVMFKKNKAKSAYDKLKLLLQHSLIWYRDKLFHGCMAMHALAEFSGREDGLEIIEACQAFKRWQLSFLEELTTEMTKKNPKRLAHELFIVMEGLTVAVELHQTCHLADPIVLLDKIIAEHIG